MGAGVVVTSYAVAGGGDRSHPSYGLPEGGCVIDPISSLPQFEACPEVSPSELEGEYRAAWVGVAASLAGGGLLLAILVLRSVPRGTAYTGLGAVAGGFLFASLLIYLSSFELDLLGGSIPRPTDAFDDAAKVLLVAGLLLIPAGALVRRLSAWIGRSARRVA